MSSSFAIVAPRSVETGFPRPARGTAVATFRDYVRTRKYDFGRGTAEAWGFVAFARGESEFPDVQSWRELHAYLVAQGAAPGLIDSARRTWRSFKALQSHARRECAQC